MTETGYNGWSNRPTWALALHQSNDHGMYLETQEIAREIVADESIDAEDRVTELAERLEGFWEPILDPHAYVAEYGDVLLSQWLEGPYMVLSDVADPGEIDWREIAESLLRDVTE